MPMMVIILQLGLCWLVMMFFGGVFLVILVWVVMMFFGGVWVVMTSESFVSDVTVAPFPLSDHLCFHTFYFCYFSDLI